jgi:O-Antigen ligase
VHNRAVTSEEPAAELASPLCLARGLLVVLAVVMPFEAPLFRVGPLLVTTVELALYATLAAWGLVVARRLVALARSSTGIVVERAMGDVLRDDPLGQAAILWSAVIFASALWAPSYRAAALKFALRSLSGVLAFFAARSLARPPEVSRRVLFALVGGGLLSAATAVVDWLVPSTALLWRVFRAGEFETLGLPRASGVFGYPTIGAMYWEATVPLLVVAPVLRERLRSRHGAPWGAGLAIVASALPLGGILLSATRSALAGALVACVAMAALTWRRRIIVSRIAVAVLGVLLALSAVTLRGGGFGSLLSERLQFWQDENWFRAEYMPGSSPRTVPVGATFQVAFAVRNRGRIVWRRAGDHPTHLSYHWERLGDDSAQPPANAMPAFGEFEGLRTLLPADVPPGATVRVRAVARGPAVPGAYRLRWDLVQEGVTWFGDRGNITPAERIDVTEATESSAASVAGMESALPIATPPSPSRPALWHAAILLWRGRPLLGVGPDNFRRRYEAVLWSGSGPTPYEDTRLHANNMYFETLADLGLVGLAALVFIAWALALALRAHWAAGDSAGLGFGVAAGTFFVHGASDYFLEFTPLFCLFWLLLGLTARARSKTRSSGARPDSTR